MDQKKVALFSPNPKSLYSTSVCELLIRNDIKVEAVFIKKFTISRFRKEFSRDGKRLLIKIWKKLVLKNKAYNAFSNQETILSFRKSENIELKDLRELSNRGIEVNFVEDLNDAFVENILKQRGIDLVVFTGGGLIRENILRASGFGVLNCHMGKLPEYRGMDVVEWPLLKNDFNSIGFTVHFMDSGVDTGDILKIFDVKILKGDTINTLRVRFEPIMTRYFVETVIDFLNNKITPQIQKEEDGKQYYIMDNCIKKLAELNLESYTSNLE